MVTPNVERGVLEKVSKGNKGEVTYRTRTTKDRSYSIQKLFFESLHCGAFHTVFLLFLRQASKWNFQKKHQNT